MQSSTQLGLRSLFVAAIGFLTLWTFTADAAKVSRVKGRKLLIQLEGDPAQKGEIFYLVDSTGKKKGIIKIGAVKGDRAIALLGKGSARPGFSLMARAPSLPQQAQVNIPEKSDDSSSESSADGQQRFFLGLMLGMSTDNMDVTLDVTPEETVSLSGSAMSYKAFFDYMLFPQIWFRGFFGIENFEAEGPTRCGDDQDQICTASIQYLSADMWGRYSFSMAMWRPWVGAGFSLLFPMSTDTTALEESSVTNTSVMALGGGLDVVVSDKYTIPLQIEYGLFPTSDQVSADLIAIRLGFGMNF